MLKKVNFFFILSVAFTNTLLGASYDDDILEMYAKLTPRILLMSTLKKQPDKNVGICLLHEKCDSKISLLLGEKMLTYNRKGSQDVRLNVKSVHYKDLVLCSGSEMLFLFATDEFNLKKAVAFANERRILSVAYDAKALERGADVSLFIGRKVVPYLNVSSINAKGIGFENILFRVSKIFKLDSRGEAK